MARLDRIDKYEIVEQIGIGGMSVVYKAIHPQFKKYVAIKEIRSDLASNPDIQRRVAREAEILAQLPTHPNIVTIRDALVWHAKLYLVMDLVEGGTMSDLIKQGGVNADRGAALLDQILSGLDAIHSRGIVHRDLKSSNILIDREDVAHISDFGIAESVAGPANLTAMATAKYVAPEIIDPSLGQRAAEHLSDIYSAGIVAYETLLGEARFRQSFPEVYNALPGSEAERWVRWHTDFARNAPSLTTIDPNIPRPLAAIVERMMAKNVKERYQSASQARQDLKAWIWGASDSRSRRGDNPPEDSTIPLDRLRPAGTGSRPYSPQSRSPQSRQEPDRREPYYDSSPQTRQPEPPPAPQGPPASRFNRPWVWVAAATAAMVLVVASVLMVAAGSQSGFTLVVRGAPRGSVVYVDGKRVGVPTTEDTIKVTGLIAGAPRAVRVLYEGAECDLSVKPVMGVDGKLQYIDAECRGDEKMPDEIDYNGLMVLVLDEGEFQMGDNNYQDDEKPQHMNRVESYYIDKFEVNNEQYRRFCKETQRAEPTEHPKTRQLYENNGKFPVIGVSWDDAVAYAEWAKKRLPTEAEWEKAASWNPKTRKKYQFPWGDNSDLNRARLAKEQPGSITEYETDVSPYGVRGMGGNASEWTSSIFDRYKNESPSVPDFGNGDKVVRGGSFYRQDIAQSRTTFRGHRPPDEKASATHGTAIGFRCAISANDPRLIQYLRDRKK